MPKKPFPLSLFIRLLLGIGIIGCVLLLNLWRSYETDRASDVKTLSEAAQILGSLRTYYLAHGQYPPLSDGRESLIVTQTIFCLSDEGFVSVARESCTARNYLAHVNGRYSGLFQLRPFEYRPRASDGSPCRSTGGCPDYAVPLELKTNAFFPKGRHFMTEKGIQ